MLPERSCEVNHQSHPRARERMAEGDGAAVRVEAQIICRELEVITEGEHLTANASLISKAPMSLIDRPALASAFSVEGIGPTPITSGSTPANANETSLMPLADRARLQHSRRPGGTPWRRR